MPAWAARAAALARGANDPDALSEGAIPPLPLELRSLCTGACHLCALSGGAIPPLPLEMRRECTPVRMGMSRRWCARDMRHSRKAVEENIQLKGHQAWLVRLGSCAPWLNGQLRPVDGE